MKRKSLTFSVYSEIKFPNRYGADRYFTFANGIHSVCDRLVAIEKLDQNVRIAQDHEREVRRQASRRMDSSDIFLPAQMPASAKKSAYRDFALGFEAGKTGAETVSIKSINSRELRRSNNARAFSPSFTLMVN